MRDARRLGAPTLLLVVWTVLLTGCGGGRSAAAPESRPGTKPNILFVVWDTVRADHLNLYGYDRPTTPYLNEFARQARVFDDCVAVSSTTVPTHGSMFTGLLPTEHGASNQVPVLADEFDTLAERLKAAGYDTYMFAENPYLSKAEGYESFAQGFDVVEHPWSPQNRREALRITADKLDPRDRTSELPRKVQAESQRKGGLSEWNIKACGELAQQGVERWLERRDGSHPYFIFLNYMEAHRPLIPSRRYRERTMTPEQVEASYRVDRSWLATWSYVVGLRDYAPAELALTRATYDAALLELDDLFHNLLEGLKARGALENTCVILTADHGEQLGEHHMLDHQFSMYEPLMRVPLVVYYPPGLAAGREKRPVMNLDVFPTLLELVGIPTPESSHGVSLLRPRSERSRLAEYPSPMPGPLRTVQARYPQFDPRPWLRSLRAYYEGPYKLIYGSDGRSELYDVAEDPGELRDLIQEQPQVAQRLAGNLAAVVASLKTAAPSAGASQPVVDEATRRRLERLGYSLGPEQPDSRGAGDNPDDATPPGRRP